MEGGGWRVEEDEDEEVEDEDEDKDKEEEKEEEREEKEEEEREEDEEDEDEEEKEKEKEEEKGKEENSMPPTLFQFSYLPVVLENPCLCQCGAQVAPEQDSLPSILFLARTGAHAK